MSAPTPLWDRTRTRRERHFGVLIRRIGKRVTKARDKITIDDVMELLAKHEVSKKVRGLQQEFEVPQEYKDYLTKLGTTLPER